MAVLSGRSVDDGADAVDDRKHWGVTTLFLLGSYAIALNCTDLGLILAVVGATASTTVSFIVPGVVYWRLHPHPHMQRTAAAALAIAGVLLVPISLVAALLPST